MEGMLIDVVIFLAAALIAVPLSIRLGFGSGLGYLLACLEFGDHHRGRRQRQCKAARERHAPW